MIRPATIEDTKPIAHIIIKAWKQAYTGIIDPDYPKNMKESTFIDIIGSNILQERETIFLYEDHAQIRGFISGKRQEGTYDCQVIGFYILPEYQGKGIGTALLSHMKHHFKAQGCKAMIIWTLLHAKNNSFYKNQGGIASENAQLEIGSRRYPGVGFSYTL